ncbi:dimethylaniline monooxygenase [N-oxide-forming] 2-like isoform X2 [Cyrtonyx montezumae]|uniref:dimethylaniline monooxygenase [N-oxide-forming] 2-like isoform X2 n=1 Tax=Cyrtonyx montezumae TaxID=9017 RepID=UPI0032DA0EF6
MVHRVAVIGAGASGLVATKCCLDEGLEPTCFERSEDLGGLWCFSDNADCRRVSVYRSIISNTSKEMSCFSDFPCPEDFPNFLPHSLLVEYFRMYARHFQLLRYIRFKATVISVRKRPDFATSGQWEVVTDTEGIQESHVFDAVMVCTGNFQHPHLPLASFPGIETRFRGQYFHSQEYKDADAFRGKRVLVVGTGNTGCDIAVEMSHVAAKVFLSARSSTWVFSRVANHGFPWDMVSTTRFNHFLEWLLPSAIMKRIKFGKMNSWFNHEIYGLASAKSSNFHFIINESLPFRMLSGTIVLKSNVKEFTETSAIFEDGTTEENIDVVVFATGYVFSFSFLEESVRNTIKNNGTLYKCIFPPQLERPTLAFIGLVKLTGSVMVGAEIQARWVTGVFAGVYKLPPTSKMMAEVLKKQLPVKRNQSEKQNLKMNFISYTSEIASCAGVKPSVLRLLVTDPRLALAIFFGPCTSYQYRLMGRGQWSGARAVILTQWQRVLKPLRTRVLADTASSHSWCWLGLLALPTALVVGVLLSKRLRMGTGLWGGLGLG